MEYILEHASLPDLANKINNNPSWLTPKRLEYLIAHRKGAIPMLHRSAIDLEVFKTILAEKGKTREYVLLLMHNDAWRTEVKTWLGSSFSVDDLGCSISEWMSDDEVQSLLPLWLKRVNIQKTPFHIPHKIVPLLTRDQCIELLKSPFLVDLPLFSSFSKESVSCELARVYYKKKGSYFVQLDYSSLPQEIQDDCQIALLYCNNNKQGYKNLSMTAKCHESVVNYVLTTWLPSGNDCVPDERDPNAYDIKKIPAAVVRTFASPSLVAEFFNKVPALRSDPVLSKRWLSDPLSMHPEMLPFFPKAEQSLFVDSQTKDMALDKRISLLFKQPELASSLINLSVQNEWLRALYRYQNVHAFKSRIQNLKFENIVRDNVDLIIEYYQKEYTRGECDRDRSQDLITNLQLASWLCEGYLSKAIEHMAFLVKSKPDLYVGLNKTLYPHSIKNLERIKMQVLEFLEAEEIQHLGM